MISAYRRPAAKALHQRLREPSRLLVILVGFGIFALPIVIMTPAILDAGTDRSTNCPHCGNKVDP